MTTSKDYRQLEQKLKRPFINWLLFFILISVLAMIGSFPVWIWYSGILALKIFLTGLIGFMFFTALTALFNHLVKSVIEDEIKEQAEKPKKKTFNERIHEKNNQQKEETKLH